MAYWLDFIYEGYTNSLVQFLSDYYKFPKGIIYQSIKSKNILINNNKINVQYRIKDQDHLIIKRPFIINGQILGNINPPRNFHKNIKNFSRYSPYDGLLEQIMIEENENFIVINKPYGWATQDGSNSPWNIDDYLTYLQKEHYLVHRLDKNTTGVLIIAKNRLWANILSTLLKNHQWKKIYYCKIPLIDEKEWSVASYIPKSFNQQELYNNEEPNSWTSFKKIYDNINENYSIIAAYPISGKKHQIRIHCMLKGYPILGDCLYGRSSGPMALHCYKIHFTYKGITYEFISKWHNVHI